MRNKNIILFIMLTCIIHICFFSCVPQAVLSVNSDVADNTRLKEYAQFPKTTTLGIQWTKYSDNLNNIQPILPVKDSVVHENSVCDPTVIKVGENDYRMWYTNVEEVEASGLIQKIYSIQYAVSSDGINWTNLTTPANVPVISHNLTSVRVSSVLVTDGSSHKYRMWYRGKESTADDSNWHLFYAYADSLPANPADPNVIWKTERFNQPYNAMAPSPDKFDSKNISRVCVINDKQAGYKMWYGGHDNQKKRKIGYASSHEGKYKWVKHYEIMNPGFAALNIFDNKYIEYPFVIKEEGVYLMWYAGYNIPWEIGLAYSLDGEKFVYYDEQFGNSTNQSVLKPEAFWEGRGVSNMCVIKDVANDKTVYKMWYTAEGNDLKLRIGYAESYQ